MRMGKEEEARPILEKAADNDEFNIRVFNTLKVLKHLDGYQTTKTAHFHLRHDPKNDKVLAAFMAKYLEDIYKEFADLFQYKPAGPFLIEVFNRHDMFSGRVVALPDLHTIGACTGRVVAMVSTRDQAKIIGKPFNWNRVLRHELVHVFNLEQTDFRVPHWFTEGLAVSLEGFPMPPAWYALLKKRVASGELMNLDNILLGFVRPGSGEDWQLAYLQSFLYVEYLKQTQGKQVVGAFLKAYADGLDTDAALVKICKTTKAQFEKDYRKHLEQLAAKFAGRAPQKVLTLRELREAVAKDPADLDLAARLAEQHLVVNDTREAAKIVDAALEKNPKHGLSNYVKARMLLAEKKPAEAIRTLERAIDEKEPKALRLLAALQFEGKNFEAAARALEQGRRAEPYDNEWLVELAKVYRQTKDEAKLLGVLKDLAPTNADDLEGRRDLCQMLAKAGNHAEAERYAREALEIDVNDAEAQRVLLAVLEAQNKTEQLKELRALLGK
jgi:tetratricopeptide (TPR) repeat protein